MEEEKSRLEITGRKLVNLLLKHSLTIGSQTLEATSAVGSGKTAILLYLASYLAKHYPEDRIFWNGSFFSPCQFLRFKKPIYDVYVQANRGIYFRDDKGKAVDLHQQEFKTYSELWNMSKPGRVSVIVLKDRTRMMDLIHDFRKNPGFITFICDEAADIFPSDSSGSLYRRIKAFSEDMKEMRKYCKALYYCSQSTRDMDWRCRGKRSVVLYGPGSQTDKGTRVYQRSVDRLVRDEKGIQCYISWAGEFGKVVFNEWFGPAPNIMTFYEESERNESETN
ncbi:MAG: hypothetical protein IMZ43_06470 [Thermoplasmata archaeon]|nr:hypothetical protein [Thermoplasmata archaeon]